MNVKLTAVKSVLYGSQRYQPGENFEAERDHALVLVATGLAGARVEEDEDVPVRAPRRRKGYRRRDLVAESPRQ